MKKILVTGAQGLLGRTLVPYFREYGYDVWCHARSEGTKGTEEHNIVSADLTKPEQACISLEKVFPEVIINLAALTDVDECEKNPQKAYLANVRIVENLTKWIVKSENECHLVQISTDQVYDGSKLHTEDEITLTNYYGFSKYAGELAAGSVHSTILRTNFFGQSLSPGRVSLSDWLVESLRKEKEITVFNDISFTPLSIQSLIQMIELTINKHHSGTYNLGSKSGMTKSDFAFTLAEALGLSVKTMISNTSEKAKFTAYRPKDMRMNSSLFEDVFDVELPTLIQEVESIASVYKFEG